MFRRFSTAPWSHVKPAAVDPIMSLTEAFKKSKNPNKINLAIGAYRDENNKPYVFKSVTMAKNILHSKNMDNEYLPILGCEKFTNNALELALGKNLNTYNMARCQTISGTGSLRLAGEFVGRFYNKRCMYVPYPTWGNHIKIFNDAGMNVLNYNYLDSEYRVNTGTIRYMMENIYYGSVILMHVCCHNPSGMDIDHFEWKRLLRLAKERGHMIIFDNAYQGLASGSYITDIYPVRMAHMMNVPYILCQSFSKNFGLYGERVGCLSIQTTSPEERENVESQLKTIIRPMYSNPPKYGSQIVNIIMENDKIYNTWLDDNCAIYARMFLMRKKLYEALSKELPEHDWEYLKYQTGMFSYTKLNKNASTELRDSHDIYMTDDGRISVTGLNDNNLNYFINSLKEVNDKLGGKIL